jgi:hypothetical protein
MQHAAFISVCILNQSAVKHGCPADILRSVIGYMKTAKEKFCRTAARGNDKAVTP